MYNPAQYLELQFLLVTAFLEGHTIPPLYFTVS